MKPNGINQEELFILLYNVLAKFLGSPLRFQRERERERERKKERKRERVRLGASLRGEGR